MPDVDRLRIYRHCPRCGREATEVRSPQLVICRACGLNLYHNPCAATAAIVLDAEDRVLLIRRARDPGKGRLAFPGGFIDDGETAEDALRRELAEETGIAVGELEFLASRPNRYPYDGIVYPTLDFFFIARMASLEPARALEDVAGIVIRPVVGLDVDELAFESMRAAWKVFLARRPA